jgi:hypothetical protein
MRLDLWHRTVFAGLFLAALVASAAPVAAQIPVPSQGGTARVWFLRPSGLSSGGAGAAPEIFANGQPVGNLTAGTSFYRDFPAGNYTFTVQAYGLQTQQATRLQLAPGMQVYLEVSRVGSWEVGQAEGTFSAAPNTFGIFTMDPGLAQAYLATLTNLNTR